MIPYDHQKEFTMQINGKRVFKTRVRVKGGDLELLLYGKAPRGTPVMLGALQTTRAKLLADMTGAEETLSKPPAIE